MQPYCKNQVYSFPFNIFNTSGIAAQSATVKHHADGLGSRIGNKRTQPCPLRGRLQYLCEQPESGRTDTGSGQGVRGEQTEAEIGESGSASSDKYH